MVTIPQFDWLIRNRSVGSAMGDTLTRDETSSGERLRMGILGILGDMGTPGVAGLRVGGVQGQSSGIDSSPSHVERVLTYFTHVTQYTHVRVLQNRTDRLPNVRLFFDFFHF